MATHVQGTMRECFAQINVETLIERQLRDPQAPLSTNERIALIVGCIRQGEEQIARVERFAEQRPFIFLGNTGAGKSTLINYLAGCVMGRVNSADLTEEQRRAFGISGANLGHVVVVNPNSAQREIMRIGHSRLAQTFMPDIVSVEGRAYCDCPGFFDNRAPEIDLANIVNTRRVILTSQGPRLVVLINYHSLRAERGRALTETIQVAEQLFGSTDVFRRCQDSLAVIVTHVPDRPRRTRTQEPLERIKQYIRSDSTLEERNLFTDPQREILRVFAEKCQIYDPEDQVDELEYNGGLRRVDLLAYLDRLQPITVAGNLFQIAMDRRKVETIHTICTDVMRMIENSLRESQFDDATFLLELARTLRRIEHPTIEALINTTRQGIITHFSRLVSQVQEELLNNPNDLTERAQQLLEHISNGIAAFDPVDREDIEREIGLAGLHRTCAKHSRRIDFYREKCVLKIRIRAFKERCLAKDFDGAQIILTEIDQSVTRINETYADIGMNLDLQENLQAELAAARQNHENQEAFNRQYEELRQQQQQLLQQAVDAQGETRALMQESLNAVNANISQLIQTMQTQQQQPVVVERDDTFKDILKTVVPMIVGKMVGAPVVS